MEIDVSHSKTSETGPKTWRGTSITDICRGKGYWYFAVSPVQPSRYHSVLYEIPATFDDIPKPHISSEQHLWDDDHVRMPHSEKNLFPVFENGAEFIQQRWPVIQKALSEPIKSSLEFEAALNKYNSSLPKFEALHYFFNESLTEEESIKFFSEILPNIIKLALELPEIIPCGIPLLRQNHNRSLSLSQIQIACLLANAFLCTFPWRKSVAVSFPGVNFVGLYSSFARPLRRQCISEKLKCICNYFRRVTQNKPKGTVTFERKFVPKGNLPRWDTVENNLGNTRIHVTYTGTIEDDGLGFLQVDFANKNIGGGVLRYGCVQEEIRFVLCPELIVGRLFVEQLRNNEAVSITGVERYNNYSGYGDTFQWAGNHNDNTPVDDYGRRKTTICVIDAIRFKKPEDQFQSSLILRELNKAFVGFSSREKYNLSPVATGNWGCGAFNGSKQLKTLIQLMACSVAQRDLIYFSFGDKDLMESFYQIHIFMSNNQITVAQIWRFLGQFSVADLSEDKLYSFIQQAYFDSKKQPTISNYFVKQNDSTKEKPLSSKHFTSFLNKGPTPSASMDATSPKKSKIEDAMDINDVPSLSLSEEDLIPSSQSEPKTFKRIIKLNQKKSPEDILNKLPKTDICQIFDVLDDNGNQSSNLNTSQDLKKDVLSVFDSFILKENKTDVTKEKNTEFGASEENGETQLEEVVIISEEKMELEESTAPPKPKDFKKKITDYFIKK